MKDLGLIKRKLTKPERKEVLRVVKNVYPKGGDKALDLALSLSIIKSIN